MNHSEPEPLPSTFLRSIELAPAEEAPRLAFADWLEARGDPLGDLIRLECELGRTSALTSPYWEIKEKRDALRARIPNDRRSPLGYGDEYLPLFTDWPLEREEVWRRIDRFGDRWLHAPLDRNSGGDLSPIAATETRLACTIPTVVKELRQFVGRRFDLWQDDPEYYEPERAECFHQDFAWAWDASYAPRDDFERRYHEERLAVFNGAAPLIIGVIPELTFLTMMIARPDLHDADPPVAINHVYFPKRTTVLQYIVSQMLFTHREQWPRRSFSAGAAQVATVLATAARLGVLRRCQWFQSTFDGTEDHIVAIYEGIDGIAIHRKSPKPASVGEPRERLGFMLRSDEAMARYERELGLETDRSPFAYGDQWVTRKGD